MSGNEFEEVIRKAQRLKALRCARAHVERLERELRGERPQAADLTYVPEFLRSADMRGPQHASGESVFEVVA